MDRMFWRGGKEEGHFGLKFSGQPFKNVGAFFVGEADDVVGYSRVNGIGTLMD